MTYMDTDMHSQYPNNLKLQANSQYGKQTKVKGHFAIIGSDFYAEEGFDLIIVADPKKVVAAMRDALEDRAFVKVLFLKEGQKEEGDNIEGQLTPLNRRDYDRLIRIGAVSPGDPKRNPWSHPKGEEYGK